MFKIPRRNQNRLLIVSLLVSAIFLCFPEISSSKLSLIDSGSAVHAQSNVLTPTPVPLSPECALRCDSDGNGIITKSDLIQYANDPNEQARIMFCTQQCPFEGNPPLTPPASTTPPTRPVTPGVPTSGIVGDCSGTTPGVPDGSVDLKDVEQFRRELNKEALANGAPTLACDFDKNNVVDIIDFTNYMRVGFAAQNQQNPTAVPSPSATAIPVSPTATPTPAPAQDTVTTPTPTP
jgi:hypothetical protein